jgi:hypothetical protein
MAKPKQPATVGGKSTKLGYGGRAAKLKSELEGKGLPESEVGGIIGTIARRKGAAPGGPNYHGGKRGGK